MRKIIKNIISLLIIVLGSVIDFLLFILISFVFLFHLSWFQTKIAKIVSSYYSIELNTNLEISKLKINAFESIELEGLFVTDLHDDTLLYAPNISINIKDINLEKQVAKISCLELLRPTIKLKKYKNEEILNFQFIIDYFSTNSDEKSNFTLLIEDVELYNAKFSYKDYNKDKIKYGLDYNHISINKLNGSIQDFYNYSHLAKVSLRDFSLVEKCGLIVDNFAIDVSIDSNQIQISQLILKTSKSNISSNEFNLNYHDFNDFNDFVYSVIMKGDVQESKINLQELSYIIPQLKTSTRTIDFSGNIHGLVNDLFIDKLHLCLSEETFFNGNVEFKGLSDIEFCLIALEIEHCQTSKSDLENIDLKSLGLDNNIVLPNNLSNLGIVKLNGIVEGFYNDFIAQFDINTDRGNIYGDFMCWLNNKDGFQYSGMLNTDKLDLGLLLENKSIGTLSSYLQIDGKGLTIKEIDASIYGQVKEFSINNYMYDNISVDGNLREEYFDGKFLLFDKNIDLIFEGNFDLAHSPIIFDFNLDVQKAHLYELNFIKTRASSSLCFNLTASGFGTNLDDFSGMINVRDIGYYEKGVDYYFDSILFDSQSNIYRHNIELYSKFTEIKMAGKYSIDTLLGNLNNLGAKIVPSLISENEKYKFANDDFVLDIKIADLSKLTGLFYPSIGVASNTNLMCSFNGDQELLEIAFNSDWLRYKDMKFSGIRLDTTKRLILPDTSYLLSLEIDTVFLSPDIFLDNIKFETKAFNDKFDLNLSYKQEDSIYWGSVDAKAIIQGDSKYTFEVNNSDFYSNKLGKWGIQEGFELFIDTSSVEIKNFTAKNQNQTIQAVGKISEDSTEIFNFKLNKVMLSNLNDFIALDNIETNGIIELEGDVSNVYSNLYLNARASISDIEISEYQIGDFSAESKWNPYLERLEIDGRLYNEDGQKELSFSNCNYYTNRENNKLDFKFLYNSLNIDFVNLFLPEDVISDLKGKIDGHLDISGNFDYPVLFGFVDLKETSLIMDMFNTTYTTGGRINITKEEIYMEQFPIYDKYGSKAELNSYFYHKNFDKYDLNLVSSFAKPFMLMNTNYKMNPLYYGDAFLTGFVTVSYNEIYNLEINVDAKSEKGTDITLPLYGSEEVVLQEFITFTDNKTDKDSYEVNLEGISLNLSLDITEDANMQLVFDDLVGDAMVGRGVGHIDMFIDKFYDFSMYGQYTVSEGSYLFTLKDFINKKFRVNQGGTISWYGDPYKADLDLVAVYPLKASLYDVMPESEREEWKQKSDIDVEMKLKNSLFNPDISFNILLPRTNESARTALSNSVSTDQEMNRQVFSLLILNKFITQRQGINNSVADLSFVGSTTSEVLSNQLSNMISKFSDDFDIGFNYSPGDEISNDEVTVAMSTQQFNDRLTIKTNLGISQGNKLNHNPNAFIGDVDVEYKLNEEGNLRVHGFNESNEFDISNIDQSADYTQGVGVFYKQSFNSFAELFCEIGNLFRKGSKDCE